MGLGSCFWLGAFELQGLCSCGRYHPSVSGLGLRF